MYQERYWKELFQLKVHVNYLDIYLEKTEKFENSINIFLAITSSSSICGWVIWQKYGFVWAIIIAASQLVTAIKMYLPYKQRLKILSGLIHEFEELLHYCELKWYDVSEGKLTEEEIHNLQFEIRKRKNRSLKKHVGSTTLPEKNKYFEMALESANTYFDNFYPIKE